MIEVYDGAAEAGRIIALVSRTQNTADTDERINNRFIILSPLKNCSSNGQEHLTRPHSPSIASENDRGNFAVNYIYTS